MKKKLFQASLALLLCLFAFSCGKDEPNDPDPVDTSPSITGFTPNSGPVGTAVTINGKNFNAAPANNTVKFGTITATVGSATSSSLQVIVPEGAQTAKISVNVGGETATSSNDFTVTNPDPTTVSLDQETLDLQTLDTDQLVATVAGAGANETVVWSSDNEEAALVDQEGNVTATGAGTATITATVDGVTASCAITVNPGIIVGGNVEKNNGDYDVATYWVNGVKTELNDISSSDVLLDVSGTDIYTTFVEYDVDARYIRVMKNTTLHSTLGGLDDINKGPKAIDVVGNDVYVSGFETTENQDAKYWKNGEDTLLSNGGAAAAEDIIIHDGSVYIAGREYIEGHRARYWVDGTLHELTDGTQSATAYGICIDALGNVYTAGEEGLTSHAKVWKNDTELYQLEDQATASAANSIAIDNGTLYTTGWVNYTNGALWIDSVLAYEWPGYGSDITVFNGIIYVAGNKYDGNINGYMPTVFTFDTSGNLIEEISLLSDGSDGGLAISIVVK